MGSFESQGQTLAQNVISSAARAATLDRRRGGLTEADLNRARIDVTIPGERKRVSDLSRYPPANYGLLIESRGKTGVLLPGEAKTSRWQIAEARRQAGIGPDAPVTLYVFRAVTFRDAPG